ncbi:MAG: cation diffusion facilitator family transporter, partial [Alicyclobacillus sp.]|nr:cation diffusion facilitator family transporter [Alicyclobacillus sp.]
AGGAALFLGAARGGGEPGTPALCHPPKHPAGAAAGAAAVAIAVKQVLYRYNLRLGRRLHSRSLIAAAMDHRSDVVSSAAALVGIAVSLAGLHLGRRWMLYGDAGSSVVVAALILRIGVQVALDAVHTLMDRAVPDEQLQRYRDVIAAIPGVERIDELRARDHGQYLIVDVKISVDADITVADGHGIAADVKERMRAVFPQVLDVLVHVNPYYRE